MVGIVVRASLDRCPVELVPGLPFEDLRSRLLQANRLSDINRRILAFYLHDMDRRRLYQMSGHANTAHWAAQQLDMNPPRTRDYVRVGHALLALPLLDDAFLSGRLSWSKVVLLLRVVAVHNQQEWIEHAEKRSCAKLRNDVRRARGGRQPGTGEGKGLPHAHFGVDGLVTAEEMEIIHQCREELGGPLTDLEVLVEGSRRWLRFLQARKKKAPEQDPAKPTTDAMRDRILARDDFECLSCGTAIDLHAHHKTPREDGGPTVPDNLMTMCLKCHGLVHDGFLHVEGEIPDGVEFKSKDGEPLIAKPVIHPPDLVVRRDKLDDVRTSSPVLTVDDIPPVITGKWWREHEHLFRWNKAGTGITLR